jgi:hypothetical protein
MCDDYEDAVAGAVMEVIGDRLRALDELADRLQQVARPDGSWPSADAAEIIRQVLVKAGYRVE